MDQGLPAVELDEQALAELREDLGDSFAGFAEQFIVTARSALDEIDASLRRGDNANAIAQAHSLRGTAGYLGAITMAQALDALQKDAQSAVGTDAALRHAAKARDAFTKIQGRLLASQ